MASFSYGWRPSPPDFRDLKYGDVARVYSTAVLPKNVDLRGQCPPVYDQGDIGSCTANSLAGLGEFMLSHLGHGFTPSRLFVYYNERVLEDSVATDSGASLRDGMKVMSRFGMPPESLWWYNTSKFAVRPNRAVYEAGLRHKVLQYASLDNRNLEQLKSCLASGKPFVLGFTVYESFEAAEVEKTGFMTMPAKWEKVLGGHAVLAVGYDDAHMVFICRNSWGASWGDKGYFFMPYAYATNADLCDDFWTASLIS